MCSAGCLVDEDTKKCRVCGETLQNIMIRLGVPDKDQSHTINWLVYHQYQ